MTGKILFALFGLDVFEHRCHFRIRQDYGGAVDKGRRSVYPPDSHSGQTALPVSGSSGREHPLRGKLDRHQSSSSPCTIEPMKARVLEPLEQFSNYALKSHLILHLQNQLKKSPMTRGPYRIPDGSISTHHRVSKQRPVLDYDHGAATRADFWDIVPVCQCFHQVPNGINNAASFSLI